MSLSGSGPWRLVAPDEPEATCSCPGCPVASAAAEDAGGSLGMTAGSLSLWDATLSLG